MGEGEVHEGFLEEAGLMLEGEGMEYGEVRLKEGFRGEGNGRSKCGGREKALDGQRFLSPGELELLCPTRAWRSLSSNRRNRAASQPPN